jgi:hypothetical protein
MIVESAGALKVARGGVPAQKQRGLRAIIDLPPRT